MPRQRHVPWLVPSASATCPGTERCRQCCHLQACAKHPDLKKLVQNKGISAAYLERKCKQAVPGWRIGPQRTRLEFTPEQKRERLEYALEAVDFPKERWDSTVFCDEHTHYRSPKPLPGIHIVGRGWRRRRCAKLKDKRAKLGKWRYPKLHWFYGVHWKLGAFGPYWIHDTPGWRSAKKWKVRWHSPGSS